MLTMTSSYITFILEVSYARPVHPPVYERAVEHAFICDIYWGMLVMTMSLEIIGNNINHVNIKFNFQIETQNYVSTTLSSYLYFNA